MKINRRNLLITIGGVAISSLVGYRKLKSFFETSAFTGNIQGASFSRGHLIRDPKFPKPSKNVSTKVLIIGGGISGLSCAYHLKEKSIDDFMLLDLERTPGGNSRGGENIQGKYPQAAHYLPLPTNDSHELKVFLHKIGVITELNGKTASYNPYYLCSEPVERLYLNGRWQDGLEPKTGLQIEEQKLMEDFYKLMHRYKIAIGSDGKKAFTIPLSLSSLDPEYLKLDQISFREFLNQKNLSNQYLDWYVDYCCLDDYGVVSSEVSAWAGIHYFASRDGKGEGAQIGKNNVLTWPEGNQFLADHLLQPISQNVFPNHLAWEISEFQGKYFTNVYNFAEQTSLRVESEYIVYAAHEFTAYKVVKIPEVQKNLSEKKYAPWMVANILLKNSLKDDDLPVSWDNVSYYSDSLGYITNDNQSLVSKRLSSTITMYWPLAKKQSLKQARVKALTTTHQQWCEKVVSDLERLHPHLRKDIERIDISLFGHGMIIPEVGFLKRSHALKKSKNFLFAHSDQAGISIFEEAFYQGLNAAKEIIHGS